jgi:hypothetical protein
MMELFQKLLNAYKEADKRVGGFLPGGGTGNVLSSAVKQINPAEIAGFYGGNILNAAAKQVHSKLAPVTTSQSVEKTFKELPKLMEATSKRMVPLGYPGVWSPGFSGEPPISSPPVEEGTKVGIQVDLSAGGLKSRLKSNFGESPMFINRNPSLGIDYPTVSVGPKAPGWIIAHELGHGVDAAKRPYAYSFPKDVDFENDASLKRYDARENMRRSSPGAIVTGFGSMKDDRNKSLLQAGFEGALAGLGSEQRTLTKEVMADRYGMPIAKEAGVPWNTRQNMLAKSTYALGSATPGFVQGVVGELLGRGVDAVGDLTGTAMRAARGNKLSPVEQSLTKYGYDPFQYQMSLRDGQAVIKKQNPAQQALYNFINSK